MAVVLEDNYAPAKHMIFHNLKFLQLKSHSARKFPGEFKEFKDFEDQDAMIAKILWAGELCNSSPRLQGAMTALTS